MLRLKTVLLALLVLMVVAAPSHHADAPSAPAAALAQDTSTCDSLVDLALAQIASTCTNIGTNEVCYGNDTITATLNDDSYFFDRPGDIVPVTVIEAMQTADADTASDTWGIALLDVAADLPSDGDNVRILVFGGATVQPDVTATTADLTFCDFAYDGSDDAHLRAEPDLTATAIDVLTAGETLAVYGSTSDGEWLRSARGWVESAAGTLSCNTTDLATMDSSADAYVAPMQSFTLRVDAAANCESVPTGMLIQTPEGQTASLRVNDVQLQVGSTAAITLSGTAGCNTIESYEGNVDVVSEGVAVPVGAQVTVPFGGSDADCFAEGGSYRPIAEPLDETRRNQIPGIAGRRPGGRDIETDPWEAVDAAIDLTANGEVDAVGVVEGDCVDIEWNVEEAAAVDFNGRPVHREGRFRACPDPVFVGVLTAIPHRHDLPLQVAVVRAFATPDGQLDATLDADNDNVADIEDNCLGTFNPTQTDANANGLGDVCETFLTGDGDLDGIPDVFDNCLGVNNPLQGDADRDGRGDDCNDGGPPDADNDGVPDGDDNCVDVPNPGQRDANRNGRGDVCELQFGPDDLDGDGIPDEEDICPFTANRGQMGDENCAEERDNGTQLLEVFLPDKAPPINQDILPPPRDDNDQPPAADDGDDTRPDADNGDGRPPPPGDGPAGPGSGGDGPPGPNDQSNDGPPPPGDGPTGQDGPPPPPDEGPPPADNPPPPDGPPPPPPPGS